MKFLVHDGKVSISPDYKNGSILRYLLKDNIELFSIIERHKLQRCSKRPIGDNCPMLYAMKGEDNLTADMETVEAVYSYAQTLLDAYTFSTKFDVIVLIPSSHNIVKRLAMILSEILNINIVEGFLKKKTNGVVCKEIISDPLIPQKAKQAIKATLRNYRDDDTISIKTIPAKYRKHINVFQGYYVKLPPNSEHILLVDDIASSGTSITSASKVIQQYCKQVKTISAVTLFSPLKSKSEKR